MNKAQSDHHARGRAVQLAALGALRAHFTGSGAFDRCLRFMLTWAITSANWAARFLCLASWAVVAGLLAGPEHAVFLKQVIAWVVSSPVEMVLAQTHEGFMGVLW